MNVTCQIAHVTTGRIRLQVASMATQPEIGQFLVGFFLRIHGVTGVQVRPATGSVVVTYDPALCTQEIVLNALRSRVVQRHALEGEVRPPTETDDAISYPYLASEVIHTVAGRARFALPVVKEREDLAGVLAHFLRGQAGVQHVRLSPLSASVIVEFDADIWDAPSLLTLMRAYDPDQTDIEQWEAFEAAQPSEPGDLAARSRREVALAGSALALTILGGPLVAPLAYGLLLGSSLSLYRKAYHSLVEERRLTIDTLDATAITLLAATGVVWQAALLNLLLSSGDWIRTSTQERARRALSDVLDYMSDLAWVERDGQIVSIPAKDVAIGETIFVFPGERIPVDGVVLSGTALVDQHALTGESMPVEKTRKGEVFAATVVSEGELQVRATRIGEDTQVAQIVHLVQNAPVFDTRAQDYAERWANRLVPYSFLGAGVLALMGNIPQAITLLVIDYAAGFRVSAPTAIMSTITKAARQGILIRGGRHVEQLAEVDALVFDKTGTLTVGCPDVVGAIVLSPAHTLDEIMALAAAAESFLTHPVAEAVVKAASDRGLAIPQRTDFEYQIGQGVVATIDERQVLVGSRRFLQAQGVSFNENAQNSLRQIEEGAASPLCIAVDGVLAGLLGLADPIRPEAAWVIKKLREQGIKEVVMLTGDRAPVAEAVARTVGIERVVAEVFPADKLAAVKALQEQGYTVAVVGDGINDSPALAQADVGIAVNGGTALAQETADVVILQGDLHKLLEAFAIARQGVGLIRQNWSIIRVPNTIGLGLAFVGLLNPVTASLISDGAALVAGANSLRPLMSPSAGDAGKSARKDNRP
ncbi:MAG: heavy metal translocating P-type ATPase [Anaerolineae bacterium]|nr:heavy metal translocating P-type ATPase [Anaerolineae bacterium]